MLPSSVLASGASTVGLGPDPGTCSQTCGQDHGAVRSLGWGLLGSINQGPPGIHLMVKLCILVGKRGNRVDFPEASACSGLPYHIQKPERYTGECGIELSKAFLVWRLNRRGRGLYGFDSGRYVKSVLQCMPAVSALEFRAQIMSNV